MSFKMVSLVIQSAKCSKIDILDTKKKLRIQNLPTTNSIILFIHLSNSFKMKLIPAAVHG